MATFAPETATKWLSPVVRNAASTAGESDARRRDLIVRGRHDALFVVVHRELAGDDARTRQVHFETNLRLELSVAVCDRFGL